MFEPYGMFGGFGGPGMFELFVMITIGCIGLVILIVLIREFGEFIANSSSPIEEARARVVTKRINTSRHRSGSRMHRHTTYYVTFEFADGERREFTVWGEDYGKLVEGDSGMLTFQRKRFKSIARDGASGV